MSTKQEVDTVLREREHWRKETTQLLNAMHSVGIKVEILNKQDGYKKWWERAAVWVVVSLWALSLKSRKEAERKFADGFVTTFGSRVYWNGIFDPALLDHYAILRHECVHLYDSRGWRRFGFQLSYILLFPAIFTMRAYWERRAYVETVRSYVVAGKTREELSKICEYIAATFSGPNYAWMDPIWSGGFKPNGDVMRMVDSGSLVAEDSILAKIGAKQNALAE